MVKSKMTAEEFVDMARSDEPERKRLHDVQVLMLPGEKVPGGKERRYAVAADGFRLHAVPVALWEMGFYDRNWRKLDEGEVEGRYPDTMSSIPNCGAKSWRLELDDWTINLPAAKSLAGKAIYRPNFQAVLEVYNKHARLGGFTPLMHKWMDSTGVPLYLNPLLLHQAIMRSALESMEIRIHENNGHRGIRIDRENGWFAVLMPLQMEGLPWTLPPA